MEAGRHGGGITDGLFPGGALGGSVPLPGSKSLAQRVLVCASCCAGTTRVSGVTWSDDVSATARAMVQLGVEIDGLDSSSLSVRGCPPGPGLGWRSLPDGEEGVSLGESATAARLVTAVAALCGRPGGAITIGGSGSLDARSSPALLESLRAAGAGIVEIGGRRGGWPIRIAPVGPPSTLHLAQPSSSQELSALLIACSAWPGEFEVRVEGPLPSAPYVEMTRVVLRAFGVSVDGPAPGAISGSWLVRGPLGAPMETVKIEPDASAAAVALAGACLSGGEVRVPGLTPESSQGDVRIVQHLSAFGCRARLTTQGLFASGAATRGADCDLVGEPDLAPILAVVAADAALRFGQTSRLFGLRTLPGKESPRIEVLAAGLARVGFRVQAGADELIVGPGSGGGLRGEVRLDSRGDHRMAFAFALLGLIVPGVRVLSPGCVAKSWPGFWDEMEAAGARRLPAR